MKVVKPIQFNSLSFERDSEATYYNSTGILTTAAVDELRIGYNPETLVSIGPIFESAQTNLLLDSNYFSSTSWTKLGGSTITESAGISPDGTSNAAMLNDVGNISIRQDITGGSTANLCFSIYFKIESPSAYPTYGENVFTLSISDTSTTESLIQIKIYSDHSPEVNLFGIGSYDIEKLPNGWYRAAIYRSEISNRCRIACGVECLIYGAQAEVITGTFTKASSYILSAGIENGVRAADIQNDPPSVVSSNIAELDNPEWADDVGYAQNYVVTVLGDYNRNYKAIIDMSATVPTPFPPSDPTKWQDIGATNRWRMFDMTVGADLQTTGTDLVDVTVAVNEQINSVGLFNMIGSQAIVTMYFGEEVIYEQEINLISPPTESHWYNYWFDRRRQIKDAAFLDLPPASPSSIRVRIIGEGATSIGKMVVGYGEDTGFAEYGSTSIGITDYSTKEPDTFGNYFVQERRFVGKMSVKTVVDPGNELHVRDSLAEVRATASAYIVPTQFGPIMVLGFFKDFSVLFSTPAASYCSTEIEGI